MQLHLRADGSATNPTTPTNPPSWEQIDEAARTVALELLARLIASMLGASEEEMRDE